MRKQTGIDVVHVLWEGTGGGAERHVADLSEGLANAGVATAVLYLSRDGGIAPRLARRGIGVRTCGLTSGSDPRGPARVAREVAKMRPRILHDHVSAPWLRALLPPSRERAVVATEHGHLLRARFTRPSPRLWLERIGARRTDLFLAPSAAIADAIARHLRFPRDRIQVIPHGVAEPGIRDRRAVRTEVRSELGLDEEAIVLLFVGRIDGPKGALDLAEAFLGAAPRVPRLVLVAAGSGDRNEEFRSLLSSPEAADRVRILGYRNDAPRLFAASDIFVLPARQEAFGIVLLEAMAAELAVIGTRTGGIPEIVEADRNGILVTPGDTGALAEAVVRLAEDPGKRQSLGRAGRERWLREFALERCVERTRAAYHSLTARRM